jgi:hypothetical protein
MTSERDIERVLDHWFTERPTQVADRVLDEAADRIAHQSQQPAWLIPWRDSHVNSYLKYGAAIAAVLVVAVVGLVAVGSLTSRGGAGAPGTSATAHPASPGTSPTANVASPGPSPTPSAAAFECHGETTGCAGPLTAGEHQSANFMIDLTFTAPEGWVNIRDTPRTYGLEIFTGLGAYIEVMGMNAIAEQTESCGPVPKAGVGSAVQDFITAVQTHPGLVASEPVAAEIDGFQGQSIDFVVATSWDQMCPDIDASKPLVLILTDTGDPPGRTITYNVDSRVRWIVLDVRGETIIVELVGPAAVSSFASAVERAQPIVDSLRFGPAR